QAIVEILQEYWSDQIAIIWHIMDVKERSPSLTDDQAREVLARVMNTHDANHGINWEVLDASISVLYGECSSGNFRGHNHVQIRKSASGCG
ncbi:MAG: hypothetical protein HC768_20710, partial [Acaryochloris sp. CRU_2_0]|nr:hypothetical protein [Acaryochloris sp. CRU_2_0]